MKMTSAKWVMFAALATVLIVAAKVSAEGGPLILGESRPNAVVDGTVAVLIAFVAFWVATVVALVVVEPPDVRSHEEELP